MADEEDKINNLTISQSHNLNNLTWAMASRIILMWELLTPPPLVLSIAFRSTKLLSCTNTWWSWWWSPWRWWSCWWLPYQVDEVALLNDQNVLGEDLRITMTTIVVVVVATMVMNASMIDIKHTLRFSMRMLWQWRYLPWGSPRGRGGSGDTNLEVLHEDDPFLLGLGGEHAATTEETILEEEAVDVLILIHICRNF